MENQEKKPQNPSTFPVYERNIAGDMHLIEPGMTLRDYFAAKAMNGLMSSYSCASSLYSEIRTNAENIAKVSYKLADAMLKEREKE